MDKEIKVWRTQFKNGFISKIENGFNANKFVGTRKEYDKALEEFGGCETKGKVIGTFSYTLEEWEALHPEPIEKEEKVKKLNRWGEDISEGALNRSNTNKRYWKYL